MKEAIDDGKLIATVVGWMDETMSLEGAVQWLLAPNPQLGGKSAAWLLLNDEGSAVIEALEELKLQ